MIDLHYRPTPNGQKLAIYLEGARIPYKIVRVSLGNNDQVGTDFFKISPNNKIPALVNYDPQDGGGREPRSRRSATG
jgi:GSH-dependent disulfide-bond oxidoreductase